MCLKSIAVVGSSKSSLSLSSSFESRILTYSTFVKRVAACDAIRGCTTGFNSIGATPAIICCEHVIARVLTWSTRHGTNNGRATGIQGDNLDVSNLALQQTDIQGMLRPKSSMVPILVVTQVGKDENLAIRHAQSHIGIIGIAVNVSRRDGPCRHGRAQQSSLFQRNVILGLTTHENVRLVNWEALSLPKKSIRNEACLYLCKRTKNNT